MLWCNRCTRVSLAVVLSAATCLAFCGQHAPSTLSHRFSKQYCRGLSYQPKIKVISVSPTAKLSMCEAAKISLGSLIAAISILSLPQPSLATQQFETAVQKMAASSSFLQLSFVQKPEVPLSSSESASEKGSSSPSAKSNLIAAVAGLAALSGSFLSLTNITQVLELVKPHIPEPPKPSAVTGSVSAALSSAVNQLQHALQSPPSDATPAKGDESAAARTKDLWANVARFAALSSQALANASASSGRASPSQCCMILL